MVSKVVIYHYLCSQINTAVNKQLTSEAADTTLIWPKVPVEYNVCRNVMLRVLMTLVAVIVAVENAQPLLAIDCQTNHSIHASRL